MVRSLAATALAVAALVSLDQIPTAEAAGKTYQKGHKVELWVSKVRQMISYKAQDVLVFLFLVGLSFSAARRIRYEIHRHEQRISGQTVMPPGGSVWMDAFDMRSLKIDDCLG